MYGVMSRIVEFEGGAAEVIGIVESPTRTVIAFGRAKWSHLLAEHWFSMQAHLLTEGDHGYWFTWPWDKRTQVKVTKAQIYAIKMVRNRIIQLL